MTEPDAFALDRASLRAAFDRAATTYDTAASLQRCVADELLQRLDDVRFMPARILDVGCGTGYASLALARRYRGAELLGLDIATSMLRRARSRARWRPWARQRFLAGDAEYLPLANASVDMVYSNLALQWCDARRALGEFRRVLRPGGLLMFTTFGPDTLRELRAAWSAVDERPHVHGFLDMRDLGDLMLQGDFENPVVDVERLTQHYTNVEAVLRELKGIGAHNAARDRMRGLTGRRRFDAFRAAYEAQATTRGIPATYEIVFGHAWAPNTAHSRRLPAEAIIPLSSIRRRAR